MSFGIYDTQDNCWMGRDQGPLLYDDEKLARGAATVVNEMFEYPRGRCRARPYTVKADKLKDTVESKYTGAEAIARIEGKAT